MEYKIRRREQKDCYDIAHVVTVAWQETYRGINRFFKGILIWECPLLFR